MSRDGWQAFLAADGVGDWAVLHGGATAVFRTASMADAAALGAAMSALPGIEQAGAVLTIAGARLTARLTREVYDLEPVHIDLARAVSEVARVHGAVPQREAIQEVQLAVASKPEEASLEFWRAVCGYTALAHDSGADALGTSSTVWLQNLDTGKPLRHAMHVDVSVPLDQAPARVEAAVAAGGRLVVDEGPEWWVLADRAGNKVCVVAWPDGGVAEK